MKSVLEIEDLSFAYHGYGEGVSNHPVIENVNFSVADGNKVLILGVPDSGKSTLSRILCALIPRYLDGDISGSIRFKGEEILGIDPWDLLHICTLVAQNPQEQLLMTTCGDEVAFPLESMGMAHEKLIQEVSGALQKWGLLPLKEVNPQELSGGERKRLLLAVTEAIDAPLWIMDEPFDDLDEQWREVLLTKIQQREGTVLVFASRYLDEFRGTFDHYYLLADGTVTRDSEESIVMQFERASEFQFPVVPKTKETLSAHLSCSQLTIVHPRRSVISNEPFTLHVPEFHVEAGEIVALVGPNGSGKSTLSRVLCGLNLPLEGSINLDNKLLSAKALQATVGYLFQNPDYGIFLPTVRDELGWSLRHTSHLTAKQKEEIIKSCADLFHLQLDDNPTMMSYGARKQLQAAVYYILNRSFVIIDELDSGVTYAAAFEVVSLLQSRGAGIVIITHDRMFARNLAERQYKIVDGRVKETEVGA